MNEFQRLMDEIVQEYLFNIATLAKHDFYRNQKEISDRDRYFSTRGFEIINSRNDNYFIVTEEIFLEGCTRVFLINPVLKCLFDCHNIKNDWKYGDTFARYTISTREYELSNFLEFIICIDGKNIGCRYTPYSYGTDETMVMDRDFNYVYKQKEIPGFEVLKNIDSICAIDWSGISNEELSKIHRIAPNAHSLSEDISIKDFFSRYLSLEEYDVFISTAKEAVKKAREIIALKAVPQLMPNNMLSFKESVASMFTEEAQTSTYIFEETNSDIPYSKIDDADLMKINESEMIERVLNSIMGNSDFAKCFITSEYLFRTINNNLSIDYTSVVAGYLKSVEQLLYLFYISAFKGAKGIYYWDTCNKINRFDLTKSNYRINPYNVEEKEKKQEKYYHKIQTGKYAPTIGVLIRFLRYNDETWNVSEESKEYIVKCLLDYSKYCRNQYFHKDNIDYADYKKVEQIRNNTIVCLFYILTSFKLLDEQNSIDAQLGICDYSYELLFRKLYQMRYRIYEIDLPNLYRGLVLFSHILNTPSYEADGRLKNTEIYFQKIKEDGIENMETILGSANMSKENSLVITRELMPSTIRPVRRKSSNK